MTEAATGVRVLFTGQYWPGADTLYIARAFEKCGAIVRLLNDTTLFPGWSGQLGRAARRLVWPVVEMEWNRQLLELAKGFRPDLIYVTNADFCWPSTLIRLRELSVPIMCFYHDPQWKAREGSRFSQNITYFDLVVTTRRWQAQEYKSAGAKQVGVARFGYDPMAHRPRQLDPLAMQRYGTDISFIGTYETHRAAQMTALLGDDFPYGFQLWGGFWNVLPANSPVRRHWQQRPVHEQEISVIYAASKIALHWVNWEPTGTDEALQKGDQHNGRTFQIPACGGAMMLAQRTDEHCQFFKEDAEAVYFGSVEELRSKLDFWLHPDRDEARHKIVAAARARCLKDDYTFVPIVRNYLAHFGLAQAGRTPPRPGTTGPFIECRF